MFNSGITYRVGLGRIGDLREQADKRRRAGALRRERDRGRSINGRAHRTDALAMLNLRRPARA